VPPTKNELIVLRTIKQQALEVMAKQAGLQSLNDLKPGVVLKEEGIMSTSHQAFGWPGNVHFTLRAPAGTRAIDLSETMNTFEHEMLVKPQSRINITAASRVESKNAWGEYTYHITGEIVQ
jgi:hypothetical protein